MKRDSIQARDITRGMTIVPPIRTMRHAFVERIKSHDTTQDSWGTDAPIVPADMRNHNASYIVLMTDIGLKSYDSSQVVDVLIPEPHG